MSITSSAKFYHSIQIILGIWSCDQSLMTLTLLWDFNLAKMRVKKLQSFQRAMKKWKGNVEGIATDFTDQSVLSL